MNDVPWDRQFRGGPYSGLSEAVRGRLARFATDVLRFNRAQNLVSRQGPEARVAALIEECVVAGLILERRGLTGGRWADVGSGGGFPGLVLACLDPVQDLTLIERRRGRCDFLRREVSALGLSGVGVVEMDVVQCGEQRFDLVLAKAVAPPGEIEELCAPIVGGHLVLFGRPGDPLPAGWALAWSEPLPGERSVLRCLSRG